MAFEIGDLAASLQEENVQLFDAAYTASMDTKPFDVLVKAITSGGPAVRHTSYGDVPPMRDTTGKSVIYEDLNAFTQLVEHKVFTAGLEFTREDIADNQVADLGAKSQAMAILAANEPLRLVLENMSSPGTAFDGTAFWSDSHSIGGQTVDNKITTTVSSTSAPTAADLQAALEDAFAQMVSFPTDKGLKAGRAPNVIVTPPGLFFGVYKALNGGGTPGSVSPLPALGNAIRADVGSYALLCNPYLTGSTVFYAFHACGIAKPFGWQERERASMSKTGMDSDLWVSHGRIRQSVYMRGNRFLGDPRLGVEVTIST